MLRESNALTPTSVAHLPAPKVKALLENSRSLDTNNIRLDFPDVDQGIVLFASTNGSVETDNYSAETNSGSCNKVDQNQVHIATHTPAEMFTIQFKGNGEAGLSYQTTMSEGFHGFYVCFGNQEDGSSCGKGCGRSWTGRLFSQKGMLWIR